MDFRDYKKLKVGSKVVIISTGEEARVSAVYKDDGKVQIVANRHGLGRVTQVFHYVELARI